MNRRETLRLMGIGVVAASLPRIGGAAPAPPPGEAKTTTKVAPLSKAFRECLVEVYGGEVLGESLFGEMLDGAKTPAETYVLGSMLQLETEGKATLRPLLARLALPMRESGESRAHGVASAGKLNRLPWAERFAAIHESIEKIFLPRYLALASLVSGEEDPEAARIATFMGTHERAILAATGGVADGTADPIAPLARLLRFPIARP